MEQNCTKCTYIGRSEIVKGRKQTDKNDMDYGGVNSEQLKRVKGR